MHQFLCMIMKTRFNYFLLILLIVTTGLLSRKITGIPLWNGDVLYAVMMYFMIRFIFIHKRPALVAAVSLFLCCLIEFSQLYQASWINSVRKTLPGRLVLGLGFLWTDLIAYILGTAIALASDRFIRKRKANIN